MSKEPYKMPEYIVQDMKSRTPTGWYGLDAPYGWHRLIETLHIAIVQIDPDYKIQQIKEKFGGLRYYCAYKKDTVTRSLIQTAEARSYKICQICGTENESDKVAMSTKGHWYATLCKTCRTEYNYELIPEDDEDWYRTVNYYVL